MQDDYREINVDGYRIIKCKYIRNLQQDGSCGFCTKVQKSVSTSTAGIFGISCPGMETKCHWKSAEQAEDNGESFTEYAKGQIENDARKAGKAVVGAGRLTGRAVGATGRAVGATTRAIGEVVRETAEEERQRREERRERAEQKRLEKIAEEEYKATHKTVESKYNRAGYFIGMSGIFCCIYVLMLVILDKQEGILFPGLQWIFLLAFWFMIAIGGFTITTDDYELDTGKRNVFGLSSSIPWFLIAIVFLYIDYRYMKGAPSILKKQILTRILPECGIILVCWPLGRKMSRIMQDSEKNEKNKKKNRKKHKKS